MNIFSLNDGALNSPSNVLDPNLLSLASGITLGGFSMCGEKSGITVQYNDRSYSNKFYDNQYIDGQRLISHLIKEKKISMEFVLKGDTPEDLQDRIDQFKTATSGQKTEGVILFTVNVGGDARILKVIAEDLSFNNDGLTTNVQTGTITLVAVDPPRFYSYLLSSKYYQNITSNFSGQINNYGNAITYPVYYFVFNAATGVTSMSWTVNGYQITINQAINTGDIITISSDIYGIIQESDVYYNGTPIDSSGQITTPLTTGSNNIAFTCDGTYDVDITTIYNNMRE